MKNLTILFLCTFSVVLFSCENKTQQAKPQNFEVEPPVEQVEYVPARDTIAAPVEEKRESPLPTSPKRVRGESYSKRTEKSSYDNMRGFDPASEDDMDDNGMSRYMENNDEEGWN